MIRAGFRSSQDQQGFTLVELLVALVIFGMLSAAGVSLLSFSVKSQDVATERLDDVAAIRRLGALVASDLAQAAARPVRDEGGRTRAAFRGGSGEGETLSLALVRRGWENTEDADRPSLQKVEYGLVDGQLQRRSYRFVDGASPALSATLLEGVDNLRLRYRTRDGEWHAEWLARGALEMPVAVEMVLDMAEGGEVRQLFLTGGAA